MSASQAGHIYRLREAGAVVIWPLDDPAGTGDTYDIVSDRLLRRQPTGDYGFDGPFPGATAYRLGPAGDAATRNLHTLLANSFTPGEELVPLNRQIGTSTCTFWARSSVPLTQTNRLDLYLNAPDGSVNWAWMPVWWGNAWGGGQSWHNAGGGNLWAGRWAGLDESWAFFGATLDVTDTSLGSDGTGRLYRDGSVIGEGTPIGPRPGNMIWRGFSVNGGSADLANVALFDRVLTLPELETIRQSEEPAPAAAGVKVWDGSQWVEGTAKGWDGSQWRQAKIWTGEDWR